MTVPFVTLVFACMHSASCYCICAIAATVSVTELSILFLVLQVLTWTMPAP